MRFILFFFISLTHTHKSPALHCKTGVQEQEPVPQGLQQEKRVKQAGQRKKTAQVHEELLPAGRNYMSPPIKRMLGFMESFVPNGEKRKNLLCENVLPQKCENRGWKNMLVHAIPSLIFTLPTMSEQTHTVVKHTL